MLKAWATVNVTVCAIFLLGQRNAWHSIVSFKFVAINANTWSWAASAEQYEILKRITFTINDFLQEFYIKMGTISFFFSHLWFLTINKCFIINFILRKIKKSRNKFKNKIIETWKTFMIFLNLINKNYFSRIFMARVNFYDY